MGYLDQPAREIGSNASNILPKKRGSPQHDVIFFLTFILVNYFMTIKSHLKGFIAESDY